LDVCFNNPGGFYRAGFAELVLFLTVGCAALESLCRKRSDQLPQGASRLPHAPKGVRFPQWWMLLGALLARLSGPGALMGMERMTNLQRTSLKERLDTRINTPPLDSTYP
jgi:hypothetical protein